MVPIDPIRNANLSQVYGQRGTGKAQTGAANNTSKANPNQTTSESVAHLRELISSGEYTVDSAQVAEKILATGVLPASR